MKGLVGVGSLLGFALSLILAVISFSGQGRTTVGSVSSPAQVPPGIATSIAPPSSTLTITPQDATPGLSDILRVPDVEQIPMYPNAKDVETHKELTGTGLEVKKGDLSYSTADSVQKVGAFYQDTFPRYGWKNLVWSNDPETEAGGAFLWSNPNETSPWHLDLSLDIREQEDGSTKVWLSHTRYPNTYKGLPLYPGAQDVQIKYTDIVTQPGIIEDSGYIFSEYEVYKTYVVDAKQREIIDYYRSTMEDYGWEEAKTGWNSQSRESSNLNPPEPIKINPDKEIYFYAWLYTTKRESVGRTFSLVGLSIVTYEEQDGQTRVEMRVVATELRVAP